MMGCCPTCGRPFEVSMLTETPGWVYEYLRGSRQRQLYRGHETEFWFLSGPGQPAQRVKFSRATVEAAIAMGRLEPFWPDAPDVGIDALRPVA